MHKINAISRKLWASTMNRSRNRIHYISDRMPNRWLFFQQKWKQKPDYFATVFDINRKKSKRYLCFCFKCTKIGLRFYFVEKSQNSGLRTFFLIEFWFYFCSLSRQGLRWLKIPTFYLYYRIHGKIRDQELLYQIHSSMLCLENNVWIFVLKSVAFCHKISVCTYSMPKP